MVCKNHKTILPHNFHGIWYVRPNEHHNADSSFIIGLLSLVSSEKAFVYARMHISYQRA